MSDDTSRVLKSLQDHCLEALDAILEDTGRVKKKMNDLANSPNKTNEAAWKTLLADQITFLTQESGKQAVNLQTFASQRISKSNMSVPAQTSATNSFNGAAKAALTFIGGANTWLSNAASSTASWVPDPKAAASKVAQWDNATSAWHKGYFTTVQGWFKGDDNPPKSLLSPSHDNEQKGGSPDSTDNFSTIESLATKLQFMGMENFTIVKKDNGWALELSTE